MTDYFSDRQIGSNPRIEEKIDQVAWDGILSLIQIKIDDGSLAYGFPSHCPDGNAIDGTNVSAFSARVRAEIHDLAGEHSFSWAPPPDSLPSTLAILDFIQLIARNIGEPNQVGWHDFFSHHHLKLNREAGLKKFVEDINRIFSRNGLAYELSESGAIERTVPAPMADLVKRTSFRTGDNDLDGLLDTAIGRFLAPKPEARQDALEKLWDAFERLKTIEGGKDKKARATALIDRAISADFPVFRSVVETEFKAMTTAGNELHIRHPEVGQEPVGETGEKDYLFMRLYALVWLMLKRTRRLSEVERKDAD